MKDLQLWRFVLGALANAEPVIVMLVVRHTPGSPGRQGFKMAVTAGGRRCGTIGGGIMEFKLVRQAEVLLQREATPAIQLIPQFHTQQAPRWRSGMICAGSQMIAMCPVGKDRQGEIADLCQSLQAGKKVGMHLSPLKGVEFFAGLVDRPRYVWQGLEGGEGEAWAYEEILGPEFYMHIVGGGHVGLALSQVMANLDAYVRVFDHRPKVDTLLDNHFAHEVVLGPYDALAEKVQEGDDSYVAIVSTSFKTDEAALRQLVSKRFRYLGIMGSAAKIHHLFALLRQDGFAEEDLQRVKAPIGLPIYSRSTQEIAISIAAEVIRTKNHEKG